MIGWRIACTIQGKEVVAEVVGQPFNADTEVAIPVYHDGCIVFAFFDGLAKVKVIERY